MSFGYIPDYKGKSLLKEIYLRIFGYPYPPRRNEASIIFKFLNPKKNEKILDIGCGDGVWYNELRKRSFNVTGIDISEHDLDILNRRAKEMNLESDILKADAQKMPFKNESFDKAYSICTFEHIRDDEKVFKEAYRVLKPNGTLIISIPLDTTPLFTKIILKLPKSIKKLLFNEMVINAKNKEEYLTNFNSKYSHYRNYTLRDIREKLKNTNFNLEKISYNCRFFGSFIWSLYHTLKIFERNKSPDTNYKFKSEILYALVAPFFYLLFLVDRLFVWKKGSIIILKLRK